MDAFILLSSAQQYVLTRFFVFKYLTPWKDVLVSSFTLVLITKSCTLMPIHEVSAGVMTGGGCPISLEELSDRLVSKDIFMKIVFIHYVLYSVVPFEFEENNLTFPIFLSIKMFINELLVKENNT